MTGNIFRQLELEKYAFPVEGVDDQEIVDALKLEQPLDSITLKAPQLLAYHYGLGHRRFILSFDKGMGKTIAYLAVLYRANPELANRIIIVCSENAKLAQRREIERHLSDWHFKWTFVRGTRDQRKKAWNNPGAQVFICTYDTLQADMGERAKSQGRICPEWVTSADMAFDEWHKKLRTYKSGLFKMLKNQFTQGRMIFSSGSAGGKGVHSMWAVLHLCDSTKFKAYWPYVNRWCHIEETYFGKKIFGCTNIAAWRKFVASAVFHRRKDLKDYPPKTRQALEVEMEPWQKKIHDSLRDELFAELGDDLFVASNKLAALIKLQQFMICPKVLDSSLGYGAGLEGIWADAEESELTHFVISVPYKAPIPFIEQFFREKGLHVERLMGGDGCDVDEIARRIDRWTKRGGVIIQTIQFAESYELPAARIMYMLGYLHDPEQNSQAEDRIHRDIRVTPHPVDIYYVKHLKAYDEKILDAMSETADNLHFLMNVPLKDFIDGEA